MQKRARRDGVSILYHKNWYLSSSFLL